MNLFNRGIVLMLLLALSVGAIALAVLAWTIPNETIEWLRDAVQWLDDNDGDTEKGLLTAVAVGVALLAFVLLVLEVKPRARRDVEVTDLSGGRATLSSTAVAQRIEERVRQVPHVADARTFVTTRRKGIEVTMDLHVDPDANLAEVTNDATDAARDLLTNRMHVTLAGTPKARLHYRELNLRRPAEQATVPSPVPVAETATSEADEMAAERREELPPQSEAVQAGWRPPASPDNTDARPEATNETPAGEKPAKPEPETENKFE